jgi:hypothetical protein
MLAPLLTTLVFGALAACNAHPTAPSGMSMGSSVPVASVSSVAGGRARSTGVIFVTSQNLYFDTIVVRDPLPMHGRFQLLRNGQTEFGPGDPEYLGGRWWEDLNANGIQDSGDHFFLCPLLPPGRPTP